MATETQKKLITAEEFQEMDLGEGLHELVRGEIIEVPPAGAEHGVVCVNVSFILATYARQTGHGTVMSNDSGVVTERGPDSVRGPDLCYYSQARMPRSEIPKGWPTIMPDVVVEVVSINNRPAEMLGKVGEYLAAGIFLVLIVSPDRRSVAIYRPDEPISTILGEEDHIEGLPELPGFRCAVADFFD